jgi:hypothetical protein
VEIALRLTYDMVHIEKMQLMFELFFRVPFEWAMRVELVVAFDEELFL